MTTNPISGSPTPRDTSEHASAPKVERGEHELHPDELRRACSASQLGFELTSELTSAPVTVGQDRAVDAIQLGIAMRSAGFNLFVVGPGGTGRNSLARSFIESTARTQPVPSDVCYVHNFEDPRRPIALRLPAGRGASLRDCFVRIADDMLTALTSAFEARSYRDRHEAIEQDIETRHERELEEISARAANSGIAVIRTRRGITIGPMRDGKLLDDEAQSKLPESERAQLERDAETVHAQIHEALQRLPQLQHEQRDRIRALSEEVTRSVAHELLAAVRSAFQDLPQVMEHIARVERDIVDNVGELLAGHEGVELAMPFALSASREGALRRYRVNLIVDHRQSTGAPVVLVEHPSSGNLFGKVEHMSQLGMLVTDFNLIEPGAMHRVNGGYLIIDARRLLMQPVAYEQLKRTLRSGELKIESVAEALDLSVASTLEPEPIAFAAKIVLIGEPWLYHQLCEVDPELEELFKVVADFAGDVERSDDACRSYARMLGQRARAEGLRPLTAASIARLIEEASRDAEDSTRLSMHVRAAMDRIREADHWAAARRRDVIEPEDIERAIEQRRFRTGRLHERALVAIQDGTVHVDTSGHVVGQLNALSIVGLGKVSFGVPARITSRVRMGQGEVIDIAREVKMGGPIHSKGVLILATFLGSRYQTHRPLSLHASLVFEQSYGLIEGDSASLAELLTLLSAIGELPIAQNVAVTGSVDQHGGVQAVGGVNDKIEGFFDVCKGRGLDGSHGVIIPSSNRKHLMLRADVVAAAAQGAFHVWAVSSVDEAMPIVYGIPAGERDAEGAFPWGTASHAVEAGLARLGRAALEAAREAQTLGAGRSRAVDDER